MCVAGNPDADLIVAAKSANRAGLELALSRGANIDATDSLGKTAIFWACSLGHADVAKLLMDKGADVNLKDRNGMAPLMEAASQGREDLARLLLEGREIVRTDYANLADVLAAARGVKTEMVGPLRGRLIEIDAVDKKGNSALFFAVRAGKPGIVELLLEKGAHAPLRNQSGLTALDLAERQGRSDLVRIFRGFEKEKGITRKMMAAVESGNLDGIKALLAKGCSVNVQDRSGATPLIHAAAKGRVEVAKLLLDQGALINDRNNKGDTALMIAAELGRKDMMALLLNRGADPEMRNNAGSTALDAAKRKGLSEAQAMLQDHGELGKQLPVALQMGNLELVKSLVDRGAAVDSVDGDGVPAIVAAAVSGQTNIVELLLDRGANPNAKAPSGKTALGVACGDCRLDMIKALVAAGAIATMKDGFGFTPLKIAWDLKIDGSESCSAAFNHLKTYLSENDPGYRMILAAELGDVKLVRDLISAGADVDTENELEETALVAACREGRVDVAKYLLQKGADTNAALMAAAQGGHEEIARMLLNAGVEVELGVLSRAAAAGRSTLVELLLEKGADVNESFASDDEYGATPLISAAAAGHADVVTLLLTKGADPSLKDTEGKTALEVASAAGRRHVVDLLKSRQIKQGAHE
jgi:ankyrin repeat protein